MFYFSLVSNLANIVLVHNIDLKQPCPQVPPRFISQLWRKIGSEIKSGSGLGMRLDLKCTPVQ